VAQRNSGERAREEFLAEAQELIETLARDLLLLDEAQRRGQANPATLNDLFRGVHTLKGLSGMFGFDRLGRLAHVLEDTLEELRMGRIELNQPVLDVLFAGADSFSRLLLEAKDPAAAPLVDIERLREQAKGLVRTELRPRDVLDEYDFLPGVLAVLTEYEEHRLRTNLEQGLTVYRLRLRLRLDVIDTELESLKERVKGIAEVITYLPSMDGGVGESLELEMMVATRLAESELRAAFNRPDAVLLPVVKKSSGIPALRSLAPPPAPAAAGNALPPGGDAGTELSLRSLTNAVRVDIRKLDHLMNMVGELGTVRAAMQRLVDKLRPNADHALAQEAQRISRAFQRRLGAVQESVLDIRMVPLAQLFDRVAVVVRQVARDQGKEVRLVISGGDTEVDKLIAEELADPMMHIVRNAVDHGVELLAARTSANKPGQATLTINAYQKGSHVVIELSDDGRGIDTDLVRETAMRKGLLSEEAVSEISRDELLHLIFLPGFSTATQVTDISGRGVGMDVVKTNISRLGGGVEIESEVGAGTKVTITLPITLAIMTALLFDLGGRTFALPVAVIREALRLPQDSVRTIEGREVLSLRGATLPLCRLAGFLQLGTHAPEYETEVTQPRAVHESYVIVVAVGNRRLGLCVDRIAGQQDIVIKGLGRSLAGVPGISGATDLGDQRLVLVLDAASIVEEALLGRQGLALAGAAS
jgi:two-component system chemotaxis sensor kinase CheA